MRPNKNRLLNNLDFRYIAYWPEWVIYVWLGLCALIGSLLVYFLLVHKQWSVLENAQQQESMLIEDYTLRSYKAANLPFYKKQLEDLRSKLQDLLERLPQSTEVPALLDDVTRLGEGSGLNISKIDLLAEQRKEDIVELPFKIVATGNYNEIASFISSVASMPRIVTLHDYSLKPADDRAIHVEITAKTYRYEPQSDIEVKQ